MNPESKKLFFFGDHDDKNNQKSMGYQIDSHITDTITWLNKEKGITIDEHVKEKILALEIGQSTTVKGHKQEEVIDIDVKRVNPFGYKLDFPDDKS